MAENKSFLKNNNSSSLLNEENDIDYGKNKPSIFKYYIFSSWSWIISYWYITLPAILVGVFIFGMAAVQYFQGNNKPVWGMRTDGLTSSNKVKESAKNITNSEKGNYEHFLVYVSGPEIHIEIGMKDYKGKSSYSKAQKEIEKTYNKLLDSLGADKDKVKHSYSVNAIVAGKDPETDNNVHAVKPKLKDNFIFYHK